MQDQYHLSWSSWFTRLCTLLDISCQWTSTLHTQCCISGDWKLNCRAGCILTLYNLCSKTQTIPPGYMCYIHSLIPRLSLLRKVRVRLWEWGYYITHMNITIAAMKYGGFSCTCGYSKIYFRIISILDQWTQTNFFTVLSLVTGGGALLNTGVVIDTFNSNSLLSATSFYQYLATTFAGSLISVLFLVRF